jgi:ribA/ribD-fused uncharacterized protein
VTTFDVQRATAIIKRAIEHDMYTGKEVPENEADRISTAEKLVVQAQQVEFVRDYWIKTEGQVAAEKRVPHWSAANAILIEANMLVGANEEATQANGHAKHDHPTLEKIEDDLGSIEQKIAESTLMQGHQQEGGEPDVKTTQDSSASADEPVDQPAQEALVEVPATLMTRDDPKKGEVWASENGQEWRFLSDGGGSMADVMLVSTGEKAQVPASFLKRKVPQTIEDISNDDVPCVEPRKTEWVDTKLHDDVIDDFSGQYEFLSNFYPSPIVIDGISYPTIEHAFQAHKSTSDEVRRRIASEDTPVQAKKAGRSLNLRSDWEDVKIDVMRTCLEKKFASGTDCSRRLLETDPSSLIEGNTWGDTFWGVCNGVGENWLGRLLEDRREKLSKTSSQGTFTMNGPGGTSKTLPHDAPAEEVLPEYQRVASAPSSAPDTSIPDHDDEGDERYQTILEETEARYSPSGWVIPHELERPPNIMPEMLDQVSDIEAQRLHSQFNALAARAKFLHDVEDARARGCKLTRKLFMRGAKRKAKEALGNSSTITEREEWAEDNDEDVRAWGERANHHEEEARARKTFFDIYTEDVKVLSRDWTMRDKQQNN